MASHPPWWQSIVAYQIYPRSFADSNGDGIGDIDGIRAHLDHLVWLGVDAIWLSPVYRSPMADFGYDISDHCDVDPLFGTLDDAKALIDEAHELGLRVIVDFVPNHTSDAHDWFRAARSSPDHPMRDWYIWRPPGPDGGPPNNWVASWGDTPAWTLDEASGEYYLHCFLSAQPDLNWANPEVVAAMHDVLRFWLDLGVDGFRADVVHLIGKDPALPDDDPDLLPIPHVALHHDPATHPLLADIRALLDAYPGDRMMVGEIYLLDTSLVAEYYGNGDELHLCFNFPPLYAPWDAGSWRRQIERTEAELGPRGAWPTWVLSNHDNPRHRTRYGGSEAIARAAAVLLLGLRGTPFLYAGEEIGMIDAEVPSEAVVDPGGRDGCRAPIPWTSDADHGWRGATPWLPFAPATEVTDVATQRDDPSSILHLYRRLIAARRASPALRSGSLSLLDVGARPAPGDTGTGAAAHHESVVAWRRVAGDDERVVMVNFSDRPQHVDGIDGTVEVATDASLEQRSFDGVVPPDGALVVRPART
ncbi:MAG: DUF3459 domain-containing protein [Acidimicrobiia bacterium]|nr:DUF3459 domain-containing protein [Acidimicrobiia bacterium]